MARYSPPLNEKGRGSERRKETHPNRVDRFRTVARRSNHGLLALSLVATEVNDLEEANWDEEEKGSESDEGEIPTEDESDNHRADEAGGGEEEGLGRERELRNAKEELT